MANTKSAAKRARQTERRTLVNRRSSHVCEEPAQNLPHSLTGGDAAKAKAAGQAFVSTIDKAVKTGRVHKNTANRHKSAVNKALAKLAA